MQAQANFILINSEEKSHIRISRFCEVTMSNTIKYRYCTYVSHEHITGQNMPTIFLDITILLSMI